MPIRLSIACISASSPDSFDLFTLTHCHNGLFSIPGVCMLSLTSGPLYLLLHLSGMLLFNL